MSTRVSRSSSRHAAAASKGASTTVVEEAVPILPESTPLRRTRSQTAREEKAAQALQNGDHLDEDEDAPTPLRTPAKKRSSRASTTPNDISPSLRDRTNAAFDAMKESCTRYQLLAFEHVPEWLRDNRYIRGGYRANIGWRQSVESVCHLHNETVNVWSHLIAFLVMTCLLIATMMILSPHGVDRLDLDVVISSRPVCDVPVDGVRNPLCDAPPSLHSASGSITTAGSASDDPLELLHQILGDHQDEMLIELLSRIQTHVPNFQHLTQSLKEKAASIQSALIEAVPSDTTKQLKQLKDETSLTFTEYVNKMEDKLLSIKTTIGQLLSPSIKETSLKAQEEFTKLKQHLSEFSTEFSPALLHATSPRQWDVIKVTQNLFSNFLEQAHWTRQGFSLSPTMVAMPGVKVRVKPMVEGMEFGTGNLFGLKMGGLGEAIDEAIDDLGPHTTSLSATDQLETELIEKHEHFKTTIDADGQGKTTSTAIGYMTVEAHTSADKPGLVQLQLHSFLPRYPLAIFIVTAMLCLFFSSAYHLLHAVSDIWARRFQALDYAGIVLLIAGSTHPIIYYGFYCSPALKWFYISIVWALALVVFFIVVLPSYRHPRFRGLKVLCFIGLGFSGCIPLMHLNLLLGYFHFIIYWLLVMGFCYLAGAAIYLFQVPERWWPGHFDYFFSSHQLWHLSIFMAVLVHYFGLMHLFEWRMTRVCGVGMWC